MFYTIKSHKFVSVRQVQFKMKCLMLFIALIAYVNAVSEIKVRGEEWKAFKMMHSKQYDNRAEESIRFKIYMENRHLIAKHNQKYAKKEVSYQMAVNELSDMTSEEFLYTMTSRVFENMYVFYYIVSSP